MSENKCFAAPAASIRPGYAVAYSVVIDGKEILSRGEVFGFRRVGHNRAEITLLHAKTGSLFVNVLKGSTPVALTSVTFDPKGDALTALLAKQLEAQLKEQMSDFYSVFPIED
jgi:hypothetical protein